MERVAKDGIHQLDMRGSKEQDALDLEEWDVEAMDVAMRVVLQREVE